MPDQGLDDMKFTKQDDISRIFREISQVSKPPSLSDLGDEQYIVGWYWNDPPLMETCRAGMYYIYIFNHHIYSIANLDSVFSISSRVIRVFPTLRR